FMLGGSHNFAADREFAERVLSVYPQAWQVAVSNRAFLHRAVTTCLQAGVRQFLDLGSGIPAAGNVHEIARAHDPSTRVAYVDIEPVAVTHSRAVLEGTDGVSVTAADLRRPDHVLAAPGVTGVLDFAEPIALLMVSVLHFVPAADDLPGIVARYRGALAPGSMLVCSHGSTDFTDPEAASSARRLEQLTQDSAQPAYARSRAELTAVVDGFDLLEPGMVDLDLWRPEPGATYHRTGVYAMVGTLRT
ncbi:SAM-dependent methyltransferase, partial [Pseudonocardia sp. KRD291]|uniref:SAM-dependent methyltransferase n=1 Tax=Pseudonocardia sp. KRD291 TaxID=2792007 RepID=UPI001C49F5D5